MAAAAGLAWLDEAPLAPGRGGRLAGDPAWAWAFLGLAAAALAAYGLGLVVLRRGGGRLAVVAALAAAVQLAPLGAPLLLSSDAWTYWSYGRLAAVHGESPYRTAPAEVPGDPALGWVGADWRTTTSVYGPAFTLASEPVAIAAGRSHRLAAWLFKALAAAALLAAALLAARLSPRPAFALAFVGWNPLLALHGAGGGHNDALVAALAVGALALAASGRRALAGAAWAVAVLVKWLPLVWLALQALESRGARSRQLLAGSGAALALLGAAAAWRYGTDWVGALGPVADNAERRTGWSLPSRLEQLGVPVAAALALAAVALAAALAWLGREAWRGRVRLGLAAAFLLLATPYLAPWYALWAVPLAAADDDRTAQLLALALCAYLLPQTVPL